MHPLQYDLRCSAAKDNSITHAAAAPSNLDATTTMRFAATELQNAKELRTTASETAAPRPDLAAQKKNATFMQPFHCVLQHDVANPHASTHMATLDDNNHAAIPMRSATTDSRNA